MLRVGITGQGGFIGTHLSNALSLEPAKFIVVNYNRNYFDDENKLDGFVLSCDIIVHLAALNRHNNPNVIYETNINLVNALIASLERTKSNPHIIFSSTSQENKDNVYGRSKKEGRELLERWSLKSNATFTGIIIPNVFGPFGNPFYNSVVATFCHQLTHGLETKIDVDGQLKLIYVTELVEEIVNIIKDKNSKASCIIKHTSEAKVSEVLALLKKYKNTYQDDGEIPNISSVFELNLFNTFRCYMNIKEHFPVKMVEHVDSRGSFVEILRLGIGGQVSFSTTLPGVVRGNHFHTRKIERFAVIKGQALIQLRRINTVEVLEFYLDGKEPSYVDMPIWYTHNIKNIGEEVLYTSFWINEPYNPEDSDTYFTEV